MLAEVAASGFYAVVPDFFHGEPFVLDNANRPIQVWAKDHGPVGFLFLYFTENCL